MDWQEFVDRGILTEFANVFSDEASAHALLESIGVARGRIPAFRPNAEGFWRQAAARPGAIFLIPARLDDCQVPLRLADQHYVDLFSDSGYGKLRRALEVRAESLGMQASQ